MPDRVRVCTACSTCSTFTGKAAKPPKLSMETVLREVAKHPGLSASSLRWRNESCIRECMHRVHVAVRVYRISEVYRQPAPVRHRSLTLSQPVRGHRRSRTSASRWSKSVASTACANMFASIDRCEQMAKVRQTACAVSPSLSYTLAGGARQPAHSRRRLSMVENLSHRPPAPSCVQAHRYDRIPKVGRRPAPSRRRSPTQFTVAECELP